MSAVSAVQEVEQRAWPAPGVRVLVGGIGMVGLAGVLIGFGGADGRWGSPEAAALVAAGIALLVVAQLVFRGLTSVVPGEARVVQLFGRYRGTIRVSGLHWVNPFAERRRIATRAPNHETGLAKVYDADGNPIEIAAVVVRQVQDTAQAMYAVEDYPGFVATQAETAVRPIASSYPYDGRGSGALCLRVNAEEITLRLSEEITARVKLAGVRIVESRLIRLEERGVVDLDAERKAAMVSNLLVVLCSEQVTQQVVNTGSLYQ